MPTGNCVGGHALAQADLLQSRLSPSRSGGGLCPFAPVWGIWPGRWQRGSRWVYLR
jgi:hypothetical protein